MNSLPNRGSHIHCQSQVIGSPYMNPFEQQSTINSPPSSQIHQSQIIDSSYVNPAVQSPMNSLSSCSHIHQSQVIGSSSSPQYNPARLPNMLWNVGGKRKLKSKGNQRKKKKIPTWTHSFVCLSQVNQDEVPDSQERSDFQIAGLGEKRITFLVNYDATDIYCELIGQYPKLNNAGGFKLLRVPEGGGKLLDVIASPECGIIRKLLSC